MVNVVWKPKGPPWGAMAVLTAVVFGASAGLQRAAEPTPPPPAKKLTFRDIQLSVHARKALADDIALGPANLGVRVQDNVAILWGPVPAEALKRRAVEVVKKVKGIYEVRDADVYVADSGPPEMAVPPARLPAPPEAPTHTESASPDPSTGTIGALTGRPTEEASPGPAVVLRPPQPVGEPGLARTEAAAPPTPDGLAAAVDRIRQNDGRFGRIDCRLDGDVVVLRPGAGHGEDVMAFARAISHLPGLNRIVIQNDDAAAAPR